MGNARLHDDSEPFVGTSPGLCTKAMVNTAVEIMLIGSIGLDTFLVLDKCQRYWSE